MCKNMLRSLQQVSNSNKVTTAAAKSKLLQRLFVNLLALVLGFFSPLACIMDSY